MNINFIVDTFQSIVIILLIWKTSKNADETKDLSKEVLKIAIKVFKKPN